MEVMKFAGAEICAGLILAQAHADGRPLMVASAPVQLFKKPKRGAGTGWRVAFDPVLPPDGGPNA